MNLKFTLTLVYVNCAVNDQAQVVNVEKVYSASMFLTISLSTLIVFLANVQYASYQKREMVSFELGKEIEKDVGFHNLKI